MYVWAFLLCSFFVEFSLANSCKGCVTLDEYNFDKITSKFNVVLVKFDGAYPYGDKHEAYVKLGNEISHNKGILLSEVHIKDYGDKENEELGKRFNITSKDDLPALRLFVEGSKTPVQYKTSDDWSLDGLRNFVRTNVNVYIGLPGCVEAFDKIAMKFVADKNKSKKIAEVEKLAEDGDEKEKAAAKVYIQYMNKIKELGEKFIKQETSRLAKVIKDGKINEKKKEELSHRQNILHTFSVSVKDEL